MTNTSYLDFNYQTKSPHIVHSVWGFGGKNQYQFKSNQMTKRESYLQIMSDVYKEAYGVRPRHLNYHEWTLEELESEFVKLRKIIDVC